MLNKNTQLFCDTLLTKEDTTASENCFLKAMQDNDYKLTVRGADLFLDNCELEPEPDSFYRGIAIKCFMKGLLADK